MKEIGDKIPADKKTAIESALSELKEAHKLQDFAKIDQASEAMNAAWQAASQDIYQAQQNGAGDNASAADFGANAGGGNPGGNTTEDVTDVEFEEVGDKK